MFVEDGTARRDDDKPDFDHFSKEELDEYNGDIDMKKLKNK